MTQPIQFKKPGLNNIFRIIFSPRFRIYIKDHTSKIKMRSKINLYLSFFLLLFTSCGPSYYLSDSTTGRTRTGLENFISNYASGYKGKKAALVTNHSGVDFYLRQNIELIRKKNIKITMIFAPEHGLYGYENEYNENEYITSDHLNLIIYNMHHLDIESFRSLIKTSDLVIFDIQDMGMRCYTYISSLKFIMDALAGSKTELIVLDRPNPLGFLRVNGPFLENDFYSKNISAFPAPLFYNMTIGEAALYYKGEYQKDLNLKVIPMKGYLRNMRYNETKLPWIPPSPNLPSYMSSINYSAVVLLEGINLSLGRGTTKPFEYIGAPWIEPVSFCNGLGKLKISNFTFHPVYFKPSFSKYEDEICGGAHLVYTGGNFNPVEVSYKLISYTLKNYTKFQWEKFNDTYNIDYLAGTDTFRKSLVNGEDFELFSENNKKQLNSFLKKRYKYLIYDDDRNASYSWTSKQQ